MRRSAVDIRRRTSGHARLARPARAVGLLVGLTVALVVIAGLSLALGTRTTPPGELLEVLRAQLSGSTDQLTGSLRETSTIITSQRVPRTLLAIVAGAALGLAGMVVQSLTRNPLADPGLLGVNAGAALAVVCVITFAGVTRVADTVWAGFLGAGITAALVLGVARAGNGRRTDDPLALVLAGAAVSAGLSAAVGVVVLRSPDALAAFRQWTVGSLVGRELDSVLPVLPFLAVGIVLALALGPALDALALGDDVAAGLGARPGLVRALGLLAVTICSGATTAVCGPLAFIGLVVPHIARLVAGQGHRLSLPVAALAGAVMLGLADVVGRLVARPGEIQVGIILALAGAPVLLWLALRVRPS